MSESKQYLQFLKSLAPAVIVVAGLVFVSKQVGSWMEIFKRGPDRWEEGFETFGLREAGDLVALVASNSVVEFWEQSDGWFYEGKKITAACDYELEYRFDLTKAVVTIDDPVQKTLLITLPPARIKCSTNGLRVLQADGGWSPIGRYRIRPDQINKVFEKAKESALASFENNETNMRMAKQSIQNMLVALFAGAGVSRSSITFAFGESSEDAAAVSYDDEKARRDTKGSE